jgi:signal peptidase II
LVIAVAALVVAADQLTKWWAVRTLDTGDIDLFWTLRLHLVRNTGAAFSLAGGRGGLVAILAIAVVIALIAFGRGIDTNLGAIALGLVLGGAAGNLIDRVFRDGTGFLGGAVIDFVDLQWWPVFNVADAAVSVGGLLIVFVVARSP